MKMRRTAGQSCRCGNYYLDSPFLFRKLANSESSDNKKARQRGSSLFLVSAVSSGTESSKTSKTEHVVEA